MIFFLALDPGYGTILGPCPDWFKKQVPLYAIASMELTHGVSHVDAIKRKNPYCTNSSSTGDNVFVYGYSSYGM